MKDQIDAGVAAFGEVGFDRARIFFEILARLELRRIDEDAHGHFGSVFPGDLDQREMPRVESSHRGHQGQAAEFLPLGASFGNGLGDNHDFGRMYHDGTGCGYHGRNMKL